MGHKLAGCYILKGKTIKKNFQDPSQSDKKAITHMMKSMVLSEKEL